MKIIIDFLDKYPLISEKYSDFLLFKEVFHIMELKQHLTDDGLRKIVAIKASINFGLSPSLKLAFPPLPPTEDLRNPSYPSLCNKGG